MITTANAMKSSYLLTIYRLQLKKTLTVKCNDDFPTISLQIKRICQQVKASHISLKSHKNISFIHLSSAFLSKGVSSKSTGIKLSLYHHPVLLILQKIHRNTLFFSSVGTKTETSDCLVSKTALQTKKSDNQG